MAGVDWSGSDVGGRRVPGGFSRYMPTQVGASGDSVKSVISDLTTPITNRTNRFKRLNARSAQIAQWHACVEGSGRRARPHRGGMGTDNHEEIEAQDASDTQRGCRI